MHFNNIEHLEDMKNEGKQLWESFRCKRGCAFCETSFFQELTTGI